MRLEEAYANAVALLAQMRTRKVNSAFDNIRRGALRRERIVEGVLHELSHAVALNLELTAAAMDGLDDEPSDSLEEVIHYTIQMRMPAAQDRHECKTVAIELRAAELLELKGITRKPFMVVSYASEGMQTERYKKYAATAREVKRWYGRPSVEKAAHEVARLMRKGEFDGGCADQAGGAQP